MRTAGADRRSVVFILLALTPILGVLGLALVWIDGAESQASELDREIESVRIAASLDSNRHALAEAVTVFQIAALPDAPPSILAAAESIQVRITLLDSRADELDDVREEGTAFAPSSQDTDAFRGSVIEAVSAQRIGEPVSDSLIRIEEAVTVGLMSGTVPGLFVQLDQLGPTTNRLRSLIALSVDFDADLRSVLAAASQGVMIPTADLITPRPIRSLQWDESALTWNFASVDFDGETIDELDSGALTAGPLTEGFRALEKSRTAEERRLALTDLLAIDHQLADAVVEAANDVEDHYLAETDRLARRRWINVVVIGGMFILGLALLAVSRVELQRRRLVEAAHSSALTSMADKAYRDQLTGLRNRRWLDEALPDRIDELVDDDALTLIYFDLDGFKAVNDVWGHDCGDAVLRSVGRCLRSWSIRTPGWDFVRFGGDEFVGLVTGALDAEAGVIGELLDSIAEIVTPNDRGHGPLQIQASAGVAHGSVGMRPAELILRADSALSQAKQFRRGTAHFYDKNVSRTGELLPAMPSALDGDEFRVHLQPIIDLDLGKIVHVEALARWFHPNGVVGPVDFVPLAETYGLADRLTEAVVRDVSRVRAAKPLLPRVWINVSPVELTLKDFASRFLGHLEAGGLDPHLVGIEVTESAAIQNVEQVALVLGAIRTAGVLVAIDDFGAGYTPLGHLRDMPIDVIKIDGALISGIDEDPVNQEIVTGIYRTARRLDCDVVAEGVERLEELAWLRSSGIRFVQGYLLGRPVNPSDLPLSLPSSLLADSSSTAINLTDSTQLLG